MRRIGKGRDGRDVTLEKIGTEGVDEMIRDDTGVPVFVGRRTCKSCMYVRRTTSWLVGWLERAGN